MKLLSVGETNKKGMTPFPEDHAFSMLHQYAYYFVFGAAGFFTAITVIEVAVVLPPSFL
jgi:hypothetical protein